ncbi:MAG: 50S ribosomal protein L23 [Candidatus Hydrogenedentes bacterium]|nr:50S ribosomal protein L23 [Candidatus Hydrogenedentota bacterium]
MSLRPHQIVLSPLVTEESQIQVGKANQYSFRVHPGANKIQIRDAIEAIFVKEGIKVVRVNTMNYEGKLRRRLGAQSTGRRSSWKKAIVTLREGDKIELI